MTDTTISMPLINQITGDWNFKLETWYIAQIL